VNYTKLQSYVLNIIGIIIMQLDAGDEKVTLVPSQQLAFTVTDFCGYDGALFLSDIIASGFHGYDRSWLI
jgi:hypothetical protein